MFISELIAMDTTNVILKSIKAAASAILSSFEENDNGSTPSELILTGNYLFCMNFDNIFSS